MALNITPRQQAQWDRYCALSGVAPADARDNMWSLWEEHVYRPWLAEYGREAGQDDNLAWFDQMRAKAERGDTPDLSMEEIIGEIRRIRTERSGQ